MPFEYRGIDFGVHEMIKRISFISLKLTFLEKIILRGSIC